MRYIFSLALVAFIGLGSVSAQAASPTGKDFYGSLYVGPVFLTHGARWASGSGQPTPLVRDNKVSADIGYNVGGALGGWINNIQRMELSVGYRSYEIEFRANGSDSGDANVIPIMFNNYFYPLMLYPNVIPVAHQPYFGFGVGVGLWSFDLQGLDDSYDSTVSVMLTANIGYDFYLSGLKDFGIFIPARLEDLVVGVGYQYSWSNPIPKRDGGSFANEQLLQRSHSILFTARYEF